MQVYLVGGAIRDRLLGREVKERDYVVVGATPQAMLAMGYRQVGRDFPVFLHPQTHEEYALARTIRSSSHHPGQLVSDTSVTLEEDLSRRDLTVNAIAEDGEGALIDPFGGVEDLRKGVLRHVSGAFTDDPVRVLRLARLMARYSERDFQVAAETVQLIRRMAEAGELDDLVAERVWQELVKTLAEARPERFFECLRELGVLQRIFPEIDALWGVPQPKRWHPEVDCGIHTMMALAAACRLSDDPLVRFAVLTHDLGKATTPERILPSHYGHEARGARLVEGFSHRLKAPTSFREFAVRCATYHTYLHRLYELRPKTVLKLLNGLDLFRQPQNLDRFVQVCQADYQGREGFQQRDYPQARDLISAYEAAREVTSDKFRPTITGRLLGDAIHRERIRRIAQVMEPIKQQQECRQQ